MLKFTWNLKLYTRHEYRASSEPPRSIVAVSRLRTPCLRSMICVPYSRTIWTAVSTRISAWPAASLIGCRRTIEIRWVVVWSSRLDITSCSSTQRSLACDCERRTELMSSCAGIARNSIGCDSGATSRDYETTTEWIGDHLWLCTAGSTRRCVIRNYLFLSNIHTFLEHRNTGMRPVKGERLITIKIYEWQCVE